MPASPLAPLSFPNIPSIGGVQFAVAASGMRYSGRDDLFLAFFPPTTTVGGVFTQSQCPSAPVEWCKDRIHRGSARAFLCNAGNANAFTGSAGLEVVDSCANTASELLSVNPDEVFLASTGVIGEPFHPSVITEHMAALVDGLELPDPDMWERAANAIRTTDTFPKGFYSRIGDSESYVAGIAKGSGMIAPNMATMLAFIFTDMEISQSELQSYTENSVDKSFNSITVDSDTSTSDTVLTFATGESGNSVENHRLDFQLALDEVMLGLAHQIVRDGEGATKFIEITITGAENDVAAKEIAKSVGNSPLVKTAIAAEDANWGRIVMAVGKAGELAERDKLKIWIGDELVAEQGMQSAGYEESRASAHLAGQDISIQVDVGVGNGSSSVWTCDLTHGYIDINAGYRS